MEASEKPKPRTVGRPPKAPEKGKRRNYAFRMSDQTRDRVIASAEIRQCSMSEEIEHRVEMSFNWDDVDHAVNDAFLRYMRVFFGGEHNALAMAQMAAFWQRAIKTADRQVKSDTEWFNDDVKQTVMVEVLQHGVRAVVAEAAASERDRAEEARKLRRKYSFAKRGIRPSHSRGGQDGTKQHI